MASEIKLPALKEGVESVEVNEVKVGVGDVVTRDQTLLEVQADKATLPVAAPSAGKIVKLLVGAGDTIKVGQVYVVIEEGGGNGEGSAPAASTPAPATQAAPAAQQAAAPAASTPARKVPEAVSKRMHAPLPASGSSPAAGTGIVPAGPATRRLARELGVDLSQVTGSGRNGRVTEEDIKAYVRALASGAATPAGASAGPALAQPDMPPFEEFGPVDRTPVRGIRKAVARQMSLAWNLIPHVTQHDLADITELEGFRKSQSTGSVKLTVTAFVLKACAVLLKKFPHFNASFDANAGQLIYKKYYNLGVAVDTDDGLVVPVIREADHKSVQEMAAELIAVAEKARQKKLEPADMKGGTFTITNLGGIGGTGFTPIVNWPEVAILGMSRSRLTAVPNKDGTIGVRLLMPLSLSYDHRVIDGADAARFTRQLADMLENPLTMLLHA